MYGISELSVPLGRREKYPSTEATVSMRLIRISHVRVRATGRATLPWVFCPARCVRILFSLSVQNQGRKFRYRCTVI